MGLLQLLLQIRLYAFAGLDAMQDAINLGSDFIGEVCSQMFAVSALKSVCHWGPAHFLIMLAHGGSR